MTPFCEEKKRRWWNVWSRQEVEMCEKDLAEQLAQWAQLTLRVMDLLTITLYCLYCPEGTCIGICVMCQTYTTDLLCTDNSRRASLFGLASTESERRCWKSIKSQYQMQRNFYKLFIFSQEKYGEQYSTVQSESETWLLRVVYGMRHCVVWVCFFSP